MALHPPEFKRGADVIHVENWLLEMERYMRLMDCTEGQKVMLGTFLLKGDVGH